MTAPVYPKGHQKPAADLVSLPRALSKLGLCSRKQAEELIRAGEVTINGKIERNPKRRCRWQHDRIELESRTVQSATKVYLMLNKPRGLITSRQDEHNRPTIYSCLPAEMPWIFPVGRLDKASEGLILMTNDSDWASQIVEGPVPVPKVYHVQVHAPQAALPQALLDLGGSSGIQDRTELLSVQAVQVLRSGEKNTWLQITLTEGKNREIRRIMEHFRLGVLRLIRVQIGTLVLGNLAKGEWRHLSAEERDGLRTA